MNPKATVSGLSTMSVQLFACVRALSLKYFRQVPPIARLITQPDVPMFVATLCLEILKTFSTNGENTLQEVHRHHFISPIAV